MDSKRIAWLPKDSAINEFQYEISFELAEEVVKNEASLVCPNVHADYAFVGLTNSMRLILYVYCIDEEGIRRIIRARKATSNEKQAFFNHLSRREK